MLDLTKNLQTRSGNAVRILASDISDPLYPISAAVMLPTGVEKVFEYTVDGLIDSTGVQHANDLVVVPVVDHYFVNYYGISGNEIFNNRKQAQDEAAPSRLALFKVTTSDGIIAAVEMG